MKTVTLDQSDWLFVLAALNVVNDYLTPDNKARIDLITADVKNQAMNS